MSNKVKVPGGAFYAGDGLTVDPVTRTVSAGGGDVTTPDWNQNDATASDYIKNRPFYTGDPVETVLVEESTVSFPNAHSGLYGARFPISFNAEFGQTYKVSWDGTSYECVCGNYSNMPLIGNQSIMGIGSDTGEPFLIFNESGLNETGWASVTTDSSASHIISISGLVTEVVKIPDKYVSDTFRNIVTAGDPLKWSTDDWTEYYGLFQNGKLLKINVVRGSNNEGYVLSMHYNAGTGITQITTITTRGGLYYLSSNSYTNEYYWTPVFDNGNLYLRYIQTGSDKDPIKREEYDKLGLSGGLAFTTKKANEKYAFPRKVVLEGDKEIVLSSSTADSTKKFKITVDDSGNISATEVTT